MPAAGLLLTGGASRRMGRDKGSMTLPGSEESLTHRTARLLVEATYPTLEIGPGKSQLPATTEDPPGAGPLASVAAGAVRLRALGWSGPALVVATDLPRLTSSLLVWLAAHPSPRSVIPVAGGIPQTLCARYAPGDLQLAVELVATGRRSMRDLLEGTDALLVGPEVWEPAAGDGEALMDLDTPADLARLRSRPS